MSAFQSPPHCEERPYPRNANGSILFPAPWRVASFDGKAPVEFVRSVFTLALLDWHAEIGIPWTED